MSPNFQLRGNTGSYLSLARQICDLAFKNKPQKKNNKHIMNWKKCNYSVSSVIVCSCGALDDNSGFVPYLSLYLKFLIIIQPLLLTCLDQSSVLDNRLIYNVCFIIMSHFLLQRRRYSNDCHSVIGLWLLKNVSFYNRIFLYDAGIEWGSARGDILQIGLDFKELSHF